MKICKIKYKLIKNIGSMISSKKVESIITYNYDDLMEQELERRNINYTSINGKNRWLKGDIPIYHVHGLLLSDKKDIMDSDIILSEREYHKAYNIKNPLKNINEFVSGGTENEKHETRFTAAGGGIADRFCCDVCSGNDPVCTGVRQYTGEYAAASCDRKFRYTARPAAQAPCTGRGIAGGRRGFRRQHRY